MEEKDFIQEKDLHEGLAEINNFKRKEQTLMGIVLVCFALIIVLGFNLWQRNATAGQPTNGAYYGGTPAAYTSNNGASLGAGAGGCCGAGAGQGYDLNQVQSLAKDYYAKTYGDSNIEIKVQDFGCHVQCDVYKNGKLVKTLIYRNNQFSEI